MKVFITGIAGFVGANIARTMLEQGYEVHGLIRESTKLWRLEDITQDLHLHKGDLLDVPTVRRALIAAKPEVLIHTAVYGAYATQKDRPLIMRSSFLSTMDLLDASKELGVQLFINTGSSSEYGSKLKPMHESDLLEPNSYYAVGKAAQTLYCQQFAREENFPVITLRLFSVYGPYEEPGRLIPTIISKALKNEDMPISNPATARDFIYVDDVANAYIAAAQKPQLSGEIFNVGSGIQHTINDAFITVKSITQSSSKAIIGAYQGRSFDTPKWVADTEKSHKLLDFVSNTSLTDGLTKTIAWMRDNTREYEQ